MPEKELLYDIVNGTGIVTFNRPQSRNALTFEMYEGLSEICSDLSALGNGIHALIITGAGDKAFAAGTDISQFRDFSTAEDAIEYEEKMDHVLSALEEVAVPTIAAIRGACTGGGAAIAACCDLRIATPDIKFGFPIARTLGNCLSISNLSRLATLIGAARTREIILTSRLIEAPEALAIGLVSEITENATTRARELADLMATHAPLTMRATKDGLRRLREKNAEIDGSDLIRECYTSNDFREGLEAFLSKRKPKWTGS
jgi:enoyl-CoA hydratase/carnithine racemase